MIMRAPDHYYWCTPTSEARIIDLFPQCSKFQQVVVDRACLVLPQDLESFGGFDGGFRLDVDQPMLVQNARQNGPEPRQPTLSEGRSEEHTSELQSLMRISYAVFCLKKKKKQSTYTITTRHDNH